MADSQAKLEVPAAARRHDLWLPEAVRVDDAPEPIPVPLLPQRSWLVVLEAAVGGTDQQIPITPVDFQ